MTNAEKLVKNTDFLAELIAGHDCTDRNCSDCPLWDFPGLCFDKERIKEWLESEVEEYDKR